MAMPPPSPRRRARVRNLVSWLQRTVFAAQARRSRVAPPVLSNISEQSNNSNNSASEGVPMDPDALSLPPETDSNDGTPTCTVTPIGPPSSLSASRRASGASPMSRISFKSSAFQTASSRRKSTSHAHTGARPRTVARMEFENGIKLIKRNIFSRKPWRDGVHVMAIVVSNTLTSLLIAFAVALLYALGSPFTPFYPAILWAPAQTHSESKTMAFYGAMGFYFALFGCAAYVIPVAMIASRRVVGFSENQPIRSQGIRRSLHEVFKASWCALALVLAAATALMLAMAHWRVQLRENARFHLYLLSALVYFYTLYCTLKMRSLRRARAKEIRKTIRPSGWHVVRSSVVAPQPARSTSPDAASLFAPALDQANDSTTSSKDADIRSAQPLASPASSSLIGVVEAARTRSNRVEMLRRVLMHIVVFNAVFLYLHIASSLRLVEQYEFLLFASVSLVLKIAIQEVSKKVQLRCDAAARAASRKPSVRAIHVGMTVPTLAIDAQIRMVFIQNGGGQSIVASSIAIVFCEIFFRIAKILRLRYSITKRLAECKGMQRILKRVNSKLAVRDVGTARAEYSEFLDWKNFVLRVHAAEVYADMHGEYISIGLSTIVVVLMGDRHPMFDFGTVQADAGQRALAAVFQIGTGLAFDYISSVVEGVHEVPLYESIADEGASLRRLLHVLLGALTAVNVGVIGLFYLKSP